MRPEPTGWTVYDVTNGQTVCLDGTALIDLAFRRSAGNLSSTALRIGWS